MLVIIWLSLVVLLMVTAFLLLQHFFKSQNSHETWQVILDGIKEGLRGCGFHMKKRGYPIDLYIFELIDLEEDEDEVCDECLEMTSWAPMDVADWMKEGVPKHPPVFSKCGGECRCELILYETKQPSKQA